MNKMTIYLRGFREDDTYKINKWRNDSEIQKLVGTSFKYVSEEIERNWVRAKMSTNRTEIYLAICLCSSNEMIGYVSVNNINYINRSAECGGIVLDKAHQDGIARYETGLLIRELVFDHLNMNRFEGRCLVEHTASRIIMEATGYKIEGLLRQAVYKNGKYHDQYIYSLLREEYYEWIKADKYKLAEFAKMVRKLKKEYATNI